MHPRSSSAHRSGWQRATAGGSCRTAPTDLLSSLFPLHVTSSPQHREVALGLRMVAVAPLGPRTPIPNVSLMVWLFAGPGGGTEPLWGCEQRKGCARSSEGTPRRYRDGQPPTPWKGKTLMQMKATKWFPRFISHKNVTVTVTHTFYNRYHPRIPSKVERCGHKPFVYAQHPRCCCLLPCSYSTQELQSKSWASPAPAPAPAAACRALGFCSTLSPLLLSRL